MFNKLFQYYPKLKSFSKLNQMGKVWKVSLSHNFILIGLEIWETVLDKLPRYIKI